MARLIPRIAWPSHRQALWLALGAGFLLRATAAVVVQQYVSHKHPPQRCVFPDTEIYWALAQSIWHAQPYQVSLWGVPHYALRTPGYPAFLAACQAIFGPRLVPESGMNLLAVRLVQAALGAGCVWLVYRLVKAVWPAELAHRESCVAFVAAIFVAFDPYSAIISVLVLSEALFVPLMLLALWGVANLWNAPGAVGARQWWLLAIGTGLAAGSAILVRPSWTLCVPVLLLAWVATSKPADRARACAGALLVCLAAAVVMMPWWLRNASVFGRFVPTALWAGPSLYDGLNPHATGASDMSFLDTPDIRKLDETQMDVTLRERAWSFARAHPVRALQLALVKSARFWSPWPNADMFQSPLIAGASALATVPIYALMIIGLWSQRREPKAIALLAGSLIYFWLLHTLFVGSIRYRIPGAVPALGLAAVGYSHLVHRLTRGDGVSVEKPVAPAAKEAGQ